MFIWIGGIIMEKSLAINNNYYRKTDNKEIMIEIKNIKKMFGKLVVFENLNLEIKKEKW